MGQDIKTLELARIYETQGYFRTAHKIYTFLDEQKTSNEIKAGLKRCEKRMVSDKKPNKISDQPAENQPADIEPSNSEIDFLPEKKISKLLEKWLMLMVLQRRLNTYKKIQARLI